MTETLLPTNATELERAIEESVGERLDLPTPLREAVDPDVCPPAFLPFLGFERDAGLWNDAWRDPVTREAVRYEFRHKRRLGTPAGIRGRIAQVPRARLVEIVRPFAGFFASGSYADNERELAAWAAELPVIRIWPRDESGAETGGGYATNPSGPDRRRGIEAFAGSESGEPTWFAGAPPEAPWRAAIERDGGSVELEIRVLRDARRGRDNEVFEVSGRAPAADGLFAGVFWDGTCVDGAWTAPLFRRIAIDQPGRAARRPVDSLVRRSEAIQDVLPMATTIGNPRGAGLFAEDAWDGSFVDADDLIRVDFTWRLADGPADGFDGASFLDHDRFNLPPHTAEIVVELSAGPCRDAFFMNADFIDAWAFGGPYDRRALDALCEAVDAARAEHETLFIDLDARRRDFSRARSLDAIHL